MADSSNHPFIHVILAEESKKRGSQLHYVAREPAKNAPGIIWKKGRREKGKRNRVRDHFYTPPFRERRKRKGWKKQTLSVLTQKCSIRNMLCIFFLGRYVSYFLELKRKRQSCFRRFLQLFFSHCKWLFPKFNQLWIPGWVFHEPYKLVEQRFWTT